jgi:predicted ATPase
VPITSLRVQNFKCFRDSGSLRIAPLTVIFGRNNAGKSTLLQSLLLLRQTLDSGGFGATLNLRGSLFSAGSYIDLVHNHRAQENITVDIGITPEKSAEANIILEYSSGEPRPPRLVSFAVRVADQPPVEIKRGRGRSGPYELHIASERVGLEKEANFSFPAHGLLPVIGSELPRVGRPNERREAARSAARIAVAHLEESLASLRALGPFRQPPQRRYDFAGYMRDSVDAEGRNVVEALIDDVTRRGKLRGRLLREVNRWLRTVGGVQLLPFRRLGRSARIYELRLKHIDSGRWANFADVGSGIGQAFPVLVEGLRTPIGGTFLVQEPEIHLHPDAQLNVGDFLVSLAEDGRFVLAETHSENILLRIRRRIAQRTKSGLKASDVSVLFVDMDEFANSVVRELKLDDLGQIDNWPKGFMEHATEERMQLLEAAASRSEEQSG